MKNNKTIVITEHAYDRAKERRQWKRKTTDRMFQKVLENGKELKDTKGKLRKYLLKKQNGARIIYQKEIENLNELKNKKGKLKNYLLKFEKYLKYKRSSRNKIKVIIYGENLYFFIEKVKENILITTFRVPNDYIPLDRYLKN